MAREQVSPGGRALQPESLMMSHGYRPEWSEGALKCPIYQTSTFVFKSAEEGKAFFEVAYGQRPRGPREAEGLIYSRLNNPDIEVLEDRLCLWDGAEAGAVFASGMAAIATTILAFVRPGDVLLHSEPLYGGTEHLLHAVLPAFGVKPAGFDPLGGPAAMERALREEGQGAPVGMVLVETPANPTNALVDIAACAEFAGRHARDGRRPLVAVDNTFLGPVYQHPLQHGADLVLYSATKYIGGHSDVIAGVCLGHAEPMKQVRALRTFLGTPAGPWTGWLLLRSLETLKLRMARQADNARRVADFLRRQPQVERVHYLGLLEQGDPQYEIFRKQCLGPGSMVSFDLAGGEKAAFKLLNSLKLVKLAVSLGGTESLAEHPFSMTHADVPPESKQRMGLTDKMVRLSVGVEHPEDLLADLRQAMEAI